MASIDPLKHQRLLGSIAADYLGRGLSEEDLKAEGMVGLLIAHRDFDEKRGLQFSTYATPKIQQAMLRAIDNQVSLIRVPVHIHEMIRYKNSARHKRSSTSGCLKAGKQALRWHVNEATLASKSVASSLSSIAFDHRPDPLAQRIAAHDLAVLMSDLSPRETQVIRMRYGLDGEGERTQREIAQKFGTTPQNIQQIESKAMEKLRNKARTQTRRAS
jgi:RNA polymerase primary sigma factor